MTKAEQVLWSKLHQYSGAGATTVLLADSLQYAFVLDREEAVGFLQSCDRKGWGRFVVGRRGHATRLLINPKTVQTLKTWKPGEGPPAAVSAPVLTGAIFGKTAPQPAAGLIEHCYQLRPDRVIKVTLPADLTEKEAARLSKFVESLPMG